MEAARPFFMYLIFFPFAVYCLQFHSDKKELSDSCLHDSLFCDDGQCINRRAWCDGNDDCKDASDERHCRTAGPFQNPDENINNCQAHHFKCRDLICIPKSARCDDLPDCEGHEDEENCDYDSETTEPSDEADAQAIAHKIEVTTLATSTVSQLLEETDSRTIKTELETATVSETEENLRKAVRYLNEKRDRNWGWGVSTPRFATAMFLANESYFNSGNWASQLTRKELEVQLALSLMNKDHVPFRLHQLAHYIHALLIICRDPRNFHGVNLVKMLKAQVKYRHDHSHFVNPVAYLALCNARDFSNVLIRRLKNMAYRRSEEYRWLDVQAVALLTMSCQCNGPFSSTEWKALKKDVAKNITDWQQQDGSFGSVYTTGLVLQALIAAEEPGTESTKVKAFSYLKKAQNSHGSFGNDLADYYVLPALNANSLAAIGNHRCHNNDPSTPNTEAQEDHSKKKKIYIHYSLWIGGDKNEIHTITLGVAPHTDFLSIMGLAQEMNSKYKYEVAYTNRGPVVTSIAELPSDVEKSTYWTLYRKVPLPFRPLLSNSSGTVSRLRLLGGKRYIKSIRKLYPKNGEHLAFWLKPYV